MNALRYLILLGFLAITSALNAKVITVNTTNAVAAAGQVNLAGAISQLVDGDTINFNIPGAGPHYLLTPPGGYPRITKNNVTLDGYSQPGSSANTNPILAANNAKIRIVLDSRNGNLTPMAYNPANGNAGFGDSEFAVLGTFNAKNVTIKGFSLLGDKAEGHYGIAMSRDNANGALDVADATHVNGCWIGVDPDGVTVSGFADGIAAFRDRDDTVADTTLQRLPSNGHIIGVKAGSTNPRAEFNVIVGATINIIIEGQRHRISGNFIGVLPSGTKDYILPFAELGRFAEAHIEIGRGGSNLIIGTDGDGVNDADERNVFGGVVTNGSGGQAGANNLGGYTHAIEIYSLSSSPGPERTLNKIAGNYYGIGVDGVTRFTNGVPFFNGSAVADSQYWIGSDFDGVSDDIEGNVIYGNFPAGLFYSTPYFNAPALGFFDQPGNTALYSVRGNTMVNNFPFPVNPGRDGGAFLATYVGKVLLDPAGKLGPELSTNSTSTKLIGTIPVAKTNFPTAMLDLYIADPEGAANGKVEVDAGLPDGWVQGMKYLGTFVDGAAEDLNTKPGEFEFSIASLSVPAGTKVTVSATYSKDPPRTRNGRAITTLFSPPVTLAQGVAAPVLPGGVSSAKLTTLVPDQIIFNAPQDNLDNWEPFASVLGNSVFLVEANTFAEGSTENQRYAVAFQPVTGGAPKFGEVFYADDGTPYKGQVNGSRQNGNPGRVAGDKRPGAVNFITGGEASPHIVPAFGSDNRFKTGMIYAADPVPRYATVQTFSLDTAALTQKPLSKAFDAVNGRVTAGESATTPEVGRFGGELAGLDNGNFVVVVDDRSNFHATERATTAVIVAPDGKIVKDTFLVANGDIWSNVAAHKGGFTVRRGGAFYFYDNAGNLKGQTPLADGLPAGVVFDGGRGDGTRIASHINSSYVYLAGNTSESVEVDGQPTTVETVRIAVWDTRTQKLVTVANVNESTAARGGTDAGSFSADFDRVNLAVDALDRITVSYEAKPTDYEQFQIAARVLAFDGTTGKFRYLTPSFFPFVNTGPAGFRTIRASVAVTTKQILIAAKGEINSKNNPALGPDSLRQSTIYTVISHPEAKDDPTPPVTTIGGSLTGFLGYWRLDETSGETVPDSGGKGNNGTIINSSAGSWVTDAERGKVYKATGTNVISFGSIIPAMTTSNDFTWSLWIKSEMTGTAAAANNNIVFGNRYNPAGAEFAPREFVKFTPSNFEWHFNGAGQNINYTDFVTNVWAHHLVVKKGNTLTYYRDGQQANTNTITGGPLNIQPLFLGGQGTVERWRGLADEVAIFDRALSIDEAKQVFDLGKAGGSLTGTTVPPPALTVSGVTATTTSITINWSGGTAPYLVQYKASLSDAAWTTVAVTTNPTATLAKTGNVGFFRVSSGAATTLTSFKASLTGAGENPAVNTTASAFGNFTLDGTTLNYTIAFTGLSGNPTGAHIHGPAAATANAGVLIGFNPPASTSGVISGTATLSAQQVTYLQTGQLYANIHTAANAGGEIRGQILP
jgi:hypothetical protein